MVCEQNDDIKKKNGQTFFILNRVSKGRKNTHSQYRSSCILLSLCYEMFFFLHRITIHTVIAEVIRPLGRYNDGKCSTLPILGYV